MSPNFNAMELMICSAAQLLEDGKSVTVGTGAPCAAAMLAQRTTAPNLVIFFEAGGVAPQLPTMPVSVGDSRTFYRGLMATSMADIMETCQRGMMDYAFLGGAQIDAYGNLNSTLIGKEYARPRVRFPGSGGANDLASLCWRVMVITNHDRRRFVEKLDFITTPGYLDGPGARERAGLPPGGGPYRVITDLAVLGFDEGTKRMQVLSLHPGVTREQVAERTGFQLGWAEPLGTTAAPSAEALRILRDEVDPHRYLIGRG
jgi:glutaconate CoA-transferase subunit B